MWHKNRGGRLDFERTRSVDASCNRKGGILATILDDRVERTHPDLIGNCDALPHMM